MGRLSGNVRIPVVKRTVSKKAAVLGLGGTTVMVLIIIVYLYYTNRNFRDWISAAFGKKGPLPVVASAPNVAYDLIPEEVRPNSYFNIVGKFTDVEGKDVAVSQGHFYVFVEDKETSTGRQLVTTGTLSDGVNPVSSFNRMVPTPGWESGFYRVIVSDTPLTSGEIGELHPGSGPAGTGKFLQQPTSSPGLNTIPGLTVS